MRTVAIRSVVLGEGVPKVIVPICAPAASDILEAAQVIGSSSADLAEWRTDAFESGADPAAVLALLPDVRGALAEKPLLATCRTVRDGGSGTANLSDYCRLGTALCASGQIDLLDCELSAGTDAVHELVAAAHANHVAVIVSSHDFVATPSTAEMVHRLCRMQALGADVVKLAVMPHSRRDVAALLAAAAEMADCHAETPCITISMGAQGIISRLACESFGSAATFASLGRVSAPGQPSLDAAQNVLREIHAML